MDIDRPSWRSSASEDEDNPTKRKRKRTSAQTASLKAELKEMLSQPLIARGVSTRYITSGSRPIANDIIAGKGESYRCFLMTGKTNGGSDPNYTVHASMLGLTRTDAGSDLASVRLARSVGTKQDQDLEEWSGIGS